MLQEANQPENFDTTQEANLLKIVPKRPLLSSQELNWDGCCFQYHRQPAWETPPCCDIHHMIIVNHTEKIQTERWIDNRTERWIDNHRQHEQCNQGDIVVIPANTPNNHIWNRELEFSLLFFEPTHIAQIAYESIDVEQVEILPHFATPDPLIYEFCLALTSEIKLGDSYNRLYVDSLIAALSIHLIRHYAAKKPLIRDYADGLSRRKLRQAIAYIQEHLTENLSLQEMSEVVEMSPHYFTSLFKQSTGMNAYEYVIHCRMEHAKQLLSKQDLSIAEVSQQVGFQNQSHFANTFRKHTSTTPKRYREAKK